MVNVIEITNNRIDEGAFWLYCTSDSELEFGHRKPLNVDPSHGVTLCHVFVLTQSPKTSRVHVACLPKSRRHLNTQITSTDSSCARRSKIVYSLSQGDLFLENNPYIITRMEEEK